MIEKEQFALGKRFLSFLIATFVPVKVLIELTGCL